MSKTDPKAFRAYPGTLDLIPLHHAKATTTDKRGSKVPIGKRPLHRNWTERDYKRAAVLGEAQASGRNVGVRLRPDQLVIDVDPRRDGDEGFANLCLEYGIDETAFPTVVTGSGGRHLYMSKPADIAVLDSVPDFPGVEFKSKGRQVVAAGSVHPDTQKLYGWDFTAPDIADGLPPAPATLIEAIKRPEPSGELVGGGQYSQEQIALALQALDPEDFSEELKWRRLMMACHHASNGDARTEFIEWSTQDPEFSTFDEDIGRRWDSLHLKRDNLISYKTLNKFLSDAGRADLQVANTDEAISDFADEPVETAHIEDDPADGFKVYSEGANKGHVVANNQDNIRAAVHRLGASLSYNEFAGQAILEGWRGFGPSLDDAAMENLWLAVDSNFHFRPTYAFFETVVKDAARRNSFHPVRDYLAEVQPKWDGKPRVDTWLISYAGATDTEYVRAVSALPLIAAVRRVRQPGCKYDEMLVLESGQGKEKSSALEVMAVRKEWFSDSMPMNVDGKQVIEAVAGKWIIECADLHGLSKASVDSVKAMLSRTVDRARMSYGRLPIERPRQHINFGTANNRDYLKDKTGNRRFWPVAVKAFDLTALRRDRDQIWAEAAVREAAGESVRLDRSLWTVAAVEQEKRTDTTSHPYTEALQGHLDDKAGKISAESVWALLGLSRAGQRTQEQMKQLGASMKFIGWKRTRLKIDRKPKPGYTKGKQPFRTIVVMGEPASAEYESDLEFESE